MSSICAHISCISPREAHPLFKYDCSAMLHIHRWIAGIIGILYMLSMSFPTVSSECQAHKSPFVSSGILHLSTHAYHHRAYCKVFTEIEVRFQHIVYLVLRSRRVSIWCVPKFGPNFTFYHVLVWFQREKTTTSAYLSLSKSKIASGVVIPGAIIIDDDQEKPNSTIDTIADKFKGCQGQKTGHKRPRQSKFRIIF